MNLSGLIYATLTGISAGIAHHFWLKCRRLSRNENLARDCMREAMRGRDAAQRELDSRLLEDPWCTEYEPSMEIDCDCPGCRAERWEIN